MIFDGYDDEEVRLRSLIYCVCCLPPSHPKPFDNHIISNHDDGDGDGDPMKHNEAQHIGLCPIHVPRRLMMVFGIFEHSHC